MRETMMNDSTRARRRPRRARPRPARTAAAIIAITALALLTAACGGSPSSTGGSPGAAGSANSQKILAFSHCIRSHGVPDFPDPNSSGVLPKSQVAQLAASSPQFPAAHGACEHLLPNGGQPTQAQAQQAWNDMRSFARCMRSHGVPNWPDPARTSQQDQRPFFYVPGSIDPNAPQITTKIRACQHVLHASNPLVTTQ
ncbi:MAG: hypothetical protein ACRDND_32610 [Streptosporangiaceae bacterium]